VTFALVNSGYKEVLFHRGSQSCGVFYVQPLHTEFKTKGTSLAQIGERGLQASNENVMKLRVLLFLRMLTEVGVFDGKALENDFSLSSWSHTRGVGTSKIFSIFFCVDFSSIFSLILYMNLSP
jgi:hypothetical protein